MHSKQKGNIAQSAVIHALTQAGISVFVELGDYSKVDIIAEKGGIVRRIQVKYGGKKQDVAILEVKKSGPNGYRYHYQTTDVDWFALYHPASGNVYWIRADLACSHKASIAVRVVPAKNNNNQQNVNNAADYLIENMLRDFTRDTHPARTAGDDKVQTTTVRASES